MAERVKVLVPEEDVAKRIKELGEQISKDYGGETVYLICILKGSIFFTCELAKRITSPVEIDFMSVSSYGAGTSSSGVVKIGKDLDTTIEGKNVLVVEDIIDSGLTLSWLKSNLESRGARDVRIATMLRKPEAAKVEISVDFVGFDIPNEFVVGYGLDYAEDYRHLSVIGTLAPHVYGG